MPTRLVHLAVDSADPSRIARFWTAVFGWEVTEEEPEEVGIEPPGYTYPSPETIPLVFLPVPEPKTVKNRVHLDLATESEADQRAEVERLLALGATRVDIGQGDVPWVVLADPEGNEFCVLSPGSGFASTGRYGYIVIDCEDPKAVVGVWQLATGWDRVKQNDELIVLRSPHGTGPFLVLLKVPDKKTVKNRIHLDVAPEPGEDQAEAAARLREAGAVPVDIGQGEVTWQVFADPEGNEFCLLRPR
ncbi:MAG TPA: VOC family protein [Streptosporangiaceae bacterium]|nr:VOC family protein [Streptosporangiaceae bacterium]